MTKRVALYLRVSTEEQTTTKQRLELEAWATRCGHEITDAYEDHALSGAKSSDQRPAFSRLLKDAVRRRFDMVAVWAVDRLGRSLTDLLNTLQTLKQSKVDLFLHQQGIDTSTAVGNAFFQMLGVFADDAVSAVMRSSAARTQELPGLLGVRCYA